MGSTRRHRPFPLRRASLVALALPFVLAMTHLGPVDGPGAVGAADALAPEPASVYRFVLPDQAAVLRLLAHDVDLTHHIHPVAAGFEVDVVLTPSELATLALDGLQPTRTVLTPQDWQANLADLAATRQAQAAVLEELSLGIDEIRIIRADFFESRNGMFISVEAYHEGGILPTDALVATWYDAQDVPLGSQSMSRFTDAGQYLYHRLQASVVARPARVEVTSESGGVAAANVREWVGEVPEVEPTYLQDFIASYMDPTDVYQRMDALAAEFPAFTEIIELPYPTDGYARQARAVHGTVDASRVLVISHAKGHLGGNDITVTFADPGAADRSLTVTVDGAAITVSLATDAAGMITSTAAQVAAALSEHAAALVEAHTYRGNAGTGTVATGTIQLSDGLDPQARVRAGGDTPISQDPWTVRALRIRGQSGGDETSCTPPGKAPIPPKGWCKKHAQPTEPSDEERVGVLIYSQEHAREWVTPLVAVEAAERLVRNYGIDANTTSLVDELDIFIIPSVNPDGGHYSFYDYALQRKSMTSHCGPDGSDPGRENSWGVDLNRNFSVGSRFDGYSGASSSCTSSTYAGPAELSEPEARNEVWLTETYPNIRFAMNTHSYGNYFMWPPGAYISNGRETLPRPTLGEEHYFWEAGEHILGHVASHRDTVVTPARTGPVLDVLYSAAGNSADEHWYNRRIFGWDFEVGDIGFQPPWADAHEEAMEFASGIIGLLEVARDYSRDATAPTSHVVTTTSDDGGLAVLFETSEPATVYYTLDGSRPTLDSPTFEQRRMRELAGAPIEVAPGTTVHWFAVDVAGNAEGNYDPNTGTGTYRTTTVS